MSAGILSGAPWPALAALRRFSVQEYHQMIQSGILDEDDNVELLEGYVVLKMAHNPPHDTALQRTRKRSEALLPAGWDARIQCPVTLADSEPEPDIAVVRGDELTYTARHPGAADIGMLVEVSDSSLARDRDKGRIYAHAGIPIYWIANLVDRRLEVSTAPSGPSSAPGYAQRSEHVPGDWVVLSLDGATVGMLASELLP
jgi:Uma2 family endonuclease